MKLSDFIKKTLEETEATTVDFDVRVEVNDSNELEVYDYPDSAFGATSTDGGCLPRIKFTVTKDVNK